MKERSALIGSLLAGLLASACCIGPLLLGAFGLGSLGFASTLAPLRPLFLVLTVLSIGAGFYLAYRPIRERDCRPDGTCSRAPSRTAQRVVLWTVTILATGLATYPALSGYFMPKRDANATAPIARNALVLKVEGMTCAACEGEIEQQLLRVSGVIDARVDYPSGRAEIRLATATDPSPLIAAVERAGYRARVIDPRVADSPPGVSRLAGQWRGQLVVGEGRTSELVLDLGLSAGRPVGQFDLVEFGVEDYPVDVRLDGRKIGLHLTAAKIDFEGTILASGLLAGVATTQGHRDSLVLRKAGEARFSSDFLTFEKAEEDSTPVELLSADAAELRRRFNADRAHTRLLMLLSPT